MRSQSISASVVCAILIGLSIPSNVVMAEPLRTVVDANRISVLAGAAEVLEYRYDDVPFKPYVSKLVTPKELNVLLDAPHDHLHHHGLMFAVAVNDLNFWEETPTAGRQESSDLVTVSHHEDQSAPCMGFSTGVAWARVTPTSRMTELYESRFVRVYDVDGLRATVVTWRSELTNPRPRRAATLSGSHYFGLGMRFIHAMDGGEFFSADGKEGIIFRGEERLVRSNWCAYTATVADKPVTVAMLGHAENPRHPTTWFTMARPFAYLSATLNLHEQSLVLDTGERLVLRYAIVAWDDKVDRDQIDRAYRWFQSSDSGASEPMEGAERDERQDGVN